MISPRLWLFEMLTYLHAEDILNISKLQLFPPSQLEFNTPPVYGDEYFLGVTNIDIVVFQHARSQDSHLEHCECLSQTDVGSSTEYGVVRPALDRIDAGIYLSCVQFVVLR